MGLSETTGLTHEACLEAGRWASVFEKLLLDEAERIEKAARFPNGTIFDVPLTLDKDDIRFAATQMIMKLGVTHIPCP